MDIRKIMQRGVKKVIGKKGESVTGYAVFEGLRFLYQICNCFIFLASTVPFAFKSTSGPCNVLCLFLYSLQTIFDG